MNAQDHDLLQAWVDGELTGPEAARAEALAKSNPDARDFVENLRRFRQLLSQHQPARSLNVSRDFYWSGIRKGIEAAESRESRVSESPARSPFPWLAWLIPGAIVATAALFALRPGSLPSPTPPSARTPVLVNHEVESSLPEITTLTFYSSNDAMTVVWVGAADIL